MNLKNWTSVGLASVTAVALAAGAGACSSSSSAAPLASQDASPGGDDAQATPDAEGDTGSTQPPVDSGPAGKDASAEASTDGSSLADAATDGGDGGCSGVTLTVKNIKVWCSVSVAGRLASMDPMQTVCVPPGSVSLVATAIPNFVLGPAPWHDTAGDTGSGDPGTFADAGPNSTSSTTVVVTTGTKCVWVCCPGTGLPCPGPTPDQCP
jgi:hypothetical protein